MLTGTILVVLFVRPCVILNSKVVIFSWFPVTSAMFNDTCFSMSNLPNRYNISTNISIIATTNIIHPPNFSRNPILLYVARTFPHSCSAQFRSSSPTCMLNWSLLFSVTLQNR